MKQTQLRQKILAWAHSNSNIRAVIETGAFARQKPPAPDEFSDLDLEVFCESPEILTKNSDWLEEIAPVWAFQKLHNEAKIPTRLVLFEDGLKVDFTICAAIWLKLNRFSLAQQNGFQIWLDKDEILRNWQVPALELGSPKPEIWRQTLAEFWMEAWNWAKFLARNDLWHAKIRDNDCKNATLQMLEWHALSHEKAPLHAGHFVENWSPIESSELAGLWSDFEAKNQWRALENNCALFDKISREVGGKWNLPMEVVESEKIWAQIREWRKRFD